MARVGIVIASLIVFVAPSLAAAAQYPPLSTFTLPTSVAGTPVPSGLTGKPSSVDYHASCGSGLDCVQYTYILTPNVPTTAPKGIKGTDPRHFRFAGYFVDIFTTTAQAMVGVKEAHTSVPKDVDGNPMKLMANPHPINPTEWIRGDGKQHNGRMVCHVMGEVVRGKADLWAGIDTLASATVRGQPPCTNEYHWVERVLTALYPRAHGL